MRFLAALTVMSLLAAAGLAAPLRIRNGSAVRVVLHGKRETGIGIKKKGAAWRAELSVSGSDKAELVDITDGANQARWEVAPSDGVLVLDEERFIAGHAYRLTLKRGRDAVGSALVYLYPPVMRDKSHVDFHDDDTAGSDDLAVVKKPSL
jgi:hypothetical protein